VWARTKEATAKSELKTAAEAHTKAATLLKDKTDVKDNLAAELAALTTKIEDLSTKKAAAASAAKESELDEKAAAAELTTHTADLTQRKAEQAQADKDKKKNLDDMANELQAKDSDAMALVKDTKKDENALKMKEDQGNSNELSSKNLEKTTGKSAAKSLGESKEAEADEQAKIVAEEQAKQRAEMALCEAKQAQDQMAVRFTMAGDRTIDHGTGWKDFGNGYEGLRVQKLGNLCVLSGLIRVSEAAITSGEDADKKFWHAEMETLLQIGESAPTKSWGQLAQVGDECVPGTDVALSANNHANPATVRINPKGVLTFESGSSKHGWLSLSGLVYQAGATAQMPLDGNILTSMPALDEELTLQEKNTRVQTKKVLMYFEGWEKGEGEEPSVMKQGSICTMSGTINIKDKISEKVQTFGKQTEREKNAQAIVLPTICRPAVRMMFSFSHGSTAFRVDLDTDGKLIPMNVPDWVPMKLDLSTIVFSTEAVSVAGTCSKMTLNKDWTTGPDHAKDGPPHVTRQGSLCILSGVAFNAKIRNGQHSLLQNSGSPGTLPEWCRPHQRQAFSTMTATGKMQRIDVMPSGVVRWIAGAREKYVNLVGIRFNVRTDIVQKYSKELLSVSECASRR